MGILKTLSVSHKREANGSYSILLQKTPAINQPCLIFEAGTIISLELDEAEATRRNGGFARFMDGYACLGMLQYVHEGSKEILYLVIVTGCVSVGKINNNEIFCITDVSLLSMRNSKPDQEHILSVKKHLGSGCFYFSNSTSNKNDSFDLTLSAQRAHMTSSTDNRFFWNRLLFRHFDCFGIDTSFWLVKVLCGGINLSTVYIGGIQTKASLISRLSCERAGTRFNVRGVNDLGHVANFVETELAIYYNQTVLSYIITRGSIPLFWEQPGVQIGSHRIRMSRGSEISQPAYDKHMFLLKERYENVVIINLLSSRESELTLNHLFNAHHKASVIGSDFPLINFDYHALSPRGSKENLEKLFKYELDKHCNEFGFFLATKGEIIQIQRGVLRVNCLDCLDRTNSMQTFIELKMIPKFIKSLERLDVDKFAPRLIDVYEKLAVQNGDQISRIYTGTGALEGKNLLKDGTLSVARTIQNTLLDGTKQEAIDILILGRVLNCDYSYRSASFLPHYFMYASPTIQVNMCDRYLEYCSTEPTRVTVGTWNVNGCRHFDNAQYSRARPLSDWLVDYKTCADDCTNLVQAEDSPPIDIYAIGFQEIVDLNAGNIVASSSQNQRDWLAEIQKAISRSPGHRYLLLTSVQLVGVCLFVFIRSELAPFIKDVCSDQVKTGLKGATGNKGAVAIRFRYKATSLCFVCAHFAAGQNQVKERNEDYNEITRKIQFPMGRSINSHDYVFWCGDFNYRLDKLSNDDVRRAAADGDYQLLLDHDQLRLSQAAGQTFKHYIEGDIHFAPTYKYDAYSNDYDSSEKCRVPAYTDRILFKKRHETYPGEELTNPKQIKFYNRVELLSSDHRPVVSEFEIEVLEVNKKARNVVLDLVLTDCGPPDCTIFVSIERHWNITDERIFTAILKVLADEAGEIVLVRCIHSDLMVIFSEGKSAIKARSLDGSPLPGFVEIELSIILRTGNWQDVMRRELKKNLPNTPNLATGEAPVVHLEDDEDEAAQDLNMSLGPEINLDTLLMNQDVILANNEASTKVWNQPAQVQHHQVLQAHNRPLPPAPLKSPLHAPSRPPPPPPSSGRLITTSASSSSKETNNSGMDLSDHKERLDDSIFAPDPFGFNNNKLEIEKSNIPDETASIDLLEFSAASLDLDDSMLPPPPTMDPPILQPSTPSTRRAIEFPAKHTLSRPTRAAPPPPIPARSHATNVGTSRNQEPEDDDGSAPYRVDL